MSRKQSGGPGYKKGSMIKVGTLVEDLKDPTNNFIISRRDGFKIRGADNEGMCYSTNKSAVSSAVTT
jgi:hypothetical protein